MRYLPIFSLAAGLLCLTLSGHPSLAQSDDGAPAADSADDSSMDDSSSDTDDNATDDNATNDESSENDQSNEDDNATDDESDGQTMGRDEPDQQADEPADNDAADNTAAPEQEDTAPETDNKEPAAADNNSKAELDQAAPHHKKPMRQQLDTANKSTDAINRTMNCNPRLQSLQRAISQMDQAYDTNGVSRSQGSVAAYQAAKQAAIQQLGKSDAMNANQCSDTTDAMIRQVDQEAANLWSENKASGH